MRAIPIGQRVRTGLAAGAAATAVLIAAAGCTTATAGPSPTPSSSQGSGLVVTTAEGAVRGKTVAAADEFLGIPYAAPPVGALRWQPPRPPARWPGVRAAVSYAPHCPQPSSPFGRASTSEDCLYLNLFTPAGARTRNLPVMVWVHGGSLRTGESDDCGRWYVSFAVEVAGPEQLPATGRAAGVDLGIKDFAVTSDGEKIANPQKLARRGQALARYQRRLARCRKGSANRAKAKAKVARAHRKVRASRADFLHRASTRLVRGHDVIVVEDLNVAGMVRNRSLAKSISDCGWGTFRQMLEYKAARAGRHLTVVDRWYPSSKTCSVCGHLLASLSLSTRTWQCPSCGTRHDRDINAAKNILAAGLAVAGGNPGDACGADIRRHGTPRPRSAVKQEPQPVRAGIPVLQGGE